MITDIGANFRVLETRVLSAAEQLEIHCARTRFEELTNEDMQGNFTFTSARYEFANKLEEVYGPANSRDYLMFHILIGSTPSTPRKHFDFPGKHSVRKFFEDAYLHAPAGSATSL